MGTNSTVQVTLAVSWGLSLDRRMMRTPPFCATIRQSREGCDDKGQAKERYASNPTATHISGEELEERKSYINTRPSNVQAANK